MTLRQRIGIVDSFSVSRPDVIVSALIGVRYWRLGIEVCHWGVRILLITHHLCIHVR
jgi:hypothetical protein